MKINTLKRYIPCLLSGIVLAMLSISCNTTTTSETPPEAPVPTKDVTEDVAVKPPRTENFYERMLETFCQRYYNDCFSRSKYKSHSLRISNIDIRRDDQDLDYVEASGYHSCGGLHGHNDVQFEAFIIEKENDYFEVTFKKDKYLLGKIIGDESGTRTMHYVE